VRYGFTYRQIGDRMITVESLTLLLAVLTSPPPETATVLMTLAGALSAP